MAEFNEKKFKEWYSGIAKITGLDQNPDNTNHQYDYRGFYKKYAMGKEEKHLAEVIIDISKNKDTHIFTDEYKLPGHPTFSTESIYNDSSLGITGGYWMDDSTFVPSKFNIENKGKKWELKKSEKK